MEEHLGVAGAAVVVSVEAHPVDVVVLAVVELLEVALVVASVVASVQEDEVHQGDVVASDETATIFGSQAFMAKNGSSCSIVEALAVQKIKPSPRC